LEHHSIPLVRPGEYRHPREQEAADFCQIPRRTISDWVLRKKIIKGVGKNSQKRKEETLGFSRRIIWPQLEERLWSEFLSEERQDERYGRGGFEYTPNSYFEKHIQKPVQNTSDWLTGGLAGSSVSTELAFGVWPKKHKTFVQIIKYL